MAMYISVVEGKDNLRDWQPVKNLAGLVLAFSDSGKASESLRYHKAMATPNFNKHGGEVLQRVGQKYRIRRYKSLG